MQNDDKTVIFSKRVSLPSQRQNGKYGVIHTANFSPCSAHKRIFTSEKYSPSLGVRKFQPFIRLPVIAKPFSRTSLGDVDSDTRHIKKQRTDGKSKNRRSSACSSFCFVNSLTEISSIIYGKLRKSIFFSLYLLYFYTKNKTD